MTYINYKHTKISLENIITFLNKKVEQIFFIKIEPTFFESVAPTFLRENIRSTICPNYFHQHFHENLVTQLEKVSNLLQQLPDLLDLYRGEFHLLQ
jgi:hypothetical protein